MHSRTCKKEAEMKKSFVILSAAVALSVALVSCKKKPLTLDESTPMKALLKASDEEITELVKKEAAEKANFDSENLDIEYILRDEENQAIVVKMKIKEE